MPWELNQSGIVEVKGSHSLIIFKPLQKADIFAYVLGMPRKTIVFGMPMEESGVRGPHQLQFCLTSVLANEAGRPDGNPRSPRKDVRLWRNVSNTRQTIGAYFD